MRFNKQTILAALGLLTSIVSAQAVAPEDSDVIKLDADGFQSFIEANPLVLVEFFAPWCGHCKNLGPEYVKAAAELKEKNIPLVQVDCDDNKEFCMNMQIPGYPTIKVFKNSDIQNAKDYQGARSADAIVNFMVKQSLPVVINAESKADLDAIIKESRQPVIIDSGVKGLNKTFHDVANILSDSVTFVQVNDKSIKNKALSLQLPSTGEEGKLEDAIVYSGDIKKIDNDALMNWIKVESLPYFGLIDGSVFKDYVESNLPLAYFFFTTPEEYEEYTAFFTKLGKKYRGEINFVGLDASQFGRHAESLNMKEQFPLFSIHNITGDHKYGLPQLDDEEFEKLSAPLKLKEKDITKFVEDFVAGKLEPIVKSEPVPEKQETNVIKIVGTTHDEIINDPKKDVLVKYYAPWCGHCKKMAPTYLELADIYASDKDASEKVVIAELDGTLNDVDVKIEGFPTIVLYPAGKNSEPIFYQENRSLDSFLHFLKENGGNDVDGVALQAKYQEQLKAKQAAASDAEEYEDDEDDVDHDEL